MALAKTLASPHPHPLPFSRLTCSSVTRINSPFSMVAVTPRTLVICARDQVHVSATMTVVVALIPKSRFLLFLSTQPIHDMSANTSHVTHIFVRKPA